VAFPRLARRIFLFALFMFLAPHSLGIFGQSLGNTTDSSLIQAVSEPRKETIDKELLRRITAAIRSPEKRAQILPFVYDNAKQLKPLVNVLSEVLPECQGTDRYWVISILGIIGPIASCAANESIS
jgi:hypothetical protein